jgi:hypothetical protein
MTQEHGKVPDSPGKIQPQMTQMAQMKNAIKRRRPDEVLPLSRSLFFIRSICVICGSNSSIRDFAILL